MLSESLENKEIKAALVKHDVLTDHSIVNNIDNKTWMMLQHYSHAAMKIASKTYKDEGEQP